MSQFSFSKGQEITTPIKQRGDKVCTVFEVVSTDSDGRATSVRSTGELTLSEAMNTAIQKTGATSACIDHADSTIILLNHGRRDDSSYFDGIGRHDYDPV